jgi:N-acyl homoserine lactone hydrolase
MRIRCLRTGVVREREGTRGIGRYLWARWRDQVLPVNAFLVEHPAGLCLFDVGQTARAAWRGYFPRWQPFFRLARFELQENDEAALQLEALEIAPRDIRWVVLSHLHTDHVGGLAAFSGAEVIVSRAEWERATGISGRIRGYLPQHWPRGVQPRLLELDRDAVGPFPASHDLLGYGSLVVVATPGHTPGHMSLLVRGPERDVLLGGDLAHTAAHLDVVAPEIARYCAERDISYVGAHDWDAESLLEAPSPPGGTT